MKMKNYYLACTLLVCTAHPIKLQAQGYLSDATTGNAVLTRDPARQASTEIDAVVTNPAGTAFLKNGFHISANGIYSFQNIHAYSADVPQLSFKTKERRLLPAIQLAYKKNRWTIAASFSSDGGFGKRTAKDGSSMANHTFDAVAGRSLNSINEDFKDANILLQAIALLDGQARPDLQEEDQLGFISSDAKNSLYNWSTRLGTSFKFSSHLSAYVGIKANYVSADSETKGSLMIVRPSTCEKWTYSEYTEKRKHVIEQANVDEELKEKYFNSANEAAELANALFASAGASIHGLGFAPILGIDYQYGQFNFGAKYEFASHIKTKGEHFNIPASFSAGMSWQTTQRLKLAAGSNVIFASYKNVYSKNHLGKAYDLSVSGTYNITDKWLVSGGYTYSHEQASMPELTPYTVPADHYNKLSLGIAYTPIKDMQINLGISSHLHKKQYPYNMGIEGSTYSFTMQGEYKYCPKVQLALGVNYCI